MKISNNSNMHPQRFNQDRCLFNVNIDHFVMHPVIDCPDSNSHWPELIPKLTKSDESVIQNKCRTYDNSYYIWYKEASAEEVIHSSSLDNIFLYENPERRTFRSRIAIYTSRVSIYFVFVLMLLVVTAPILNSYLKTGETIKFDNNKAIRKNMINTVGFPVFNFT